VEPGPATGIRTVGAVRLPVIGAGHHSGTDRAARADGGSARADGGSACLAGRSADSGSTGVAGRAADGGSARAQGRATGAAPDAKDGAARDEQQPGSRAAA
jgi:hypothetical protein